MWQSSEQQWADVPLPGGAMPVPQATADVPQSHPEGIGSVGQQRHQCIMGAGKHGLEQAGNPARREVCSRGRGTEGGGG